MIPPATLLLLPLLCLVGGCQVGGSSRRPAAWSEVRIQAGAATWVAHGHPEQSGRYGAPAVHGKLRVEVLPRSPFGHLQRELDGDLGALLQVLPAASQELRLLRQGHGAVLQVRTAGRDRHEIPLAFVQGDWARYQRGREVVLKFRSEAVEDLARRLQQDCGAWLGRELRAAGVAVSRRRDPDHPAELELATEPLIRASRQRLLCFVEPLTFRHWVFLYEARRKSEVEHLLPRGERR